MASNSDDALENGMESSPSVEIAVGKKLSRKKRLVREVSKFFGVDEEEETKESWERRKQIHCSRYGKLKDGVQKQHSVKIDGGGYDEADGLPMTSSSILSRDSSRQLSHEQDLAIKKNSTKSQHALSLLFRYARSKVNVKPEADPSIHEGHKFRSFAKNDIENEYIDEADEPEKFFDHYEATDSFDVADGGPSDIDVIDASLQKDKQFVRDSSNITSKETTRKSSVRRTRISQTEPPVNIKRSFSEKSNVNKGFLDRLLSFRRKRHTRFDDSEVRHRPYFTYWVSFLQVVVLILTIAIYPFAPIGIHEKQVEEDVLVSRNGVLQYEKVGQTVVESIWIGPSLETLILLGAKYAPCMRRDKLIFKELEEERNKENNTGCCMQTMNSGCIQRLQYECVSSFTRYKENSVCGQDPNACLNPASVPPKEWDKSIINWPICRKTIDKSSLDKEKYPQMHCKVTGRPCCIGTQAQCIITSQDYCRFRGGVYHPDKTLCSQVNCLTSTCGLLPFINDEAPDQFYRLYLSLFIHAGIIHLVISLVINIVILRHAEKTFGWLRVLLIYLLSGIGGNLWSGILIPYEPEVGPSGALFGILSIDFVLFFNQWSSFESPWISLARLCGVLFVVFLPGILPYVDNFAHIFGFVYGCLLSPLFIRDILKRNRTLRIILLVVCSIIFLTLNIVGFILFYSVQTVGSDAIKYFNCIPLTESFCQNYHQGLYLEPRSTNY